MIQPLNLAMSLWLEAVRIFVPRIFRRTIITSSVRTCVCPCVRPSVRPCVRPCVCPDACPDDNFSIYYRISFKFSLWLSCQMTEVKFEFGSGPNFFTWVIALFRLRKPQIYGVLMITSVWMIWSELNLVGGLLVWLYRSSSNLSPVRNFLPELSGGG